MNLDRSEKYTPEMLSVVRIMVALLFLEHGTAKLLGFPPSPHGEPAFMTLMWIQGLIELFGGTLLALGLCTRPVAFILSGNMAVAYFMVMRRRASSRCSTAAMRQSSIVSCSCSCLLPDRDGGASTPN